MAKKRLNCKKRVDEIKINVNSKLKWWDGTKTVDKCLIDRVGLNELQLKKKLG